MKTPEVWKWDHPSQEFDGAPRMLYIGSLLVLQYNYEEEDGTYVDREASFEGAVAYRFTASNHSTIEHLKAYDQLVEIPSSPWLSELGSAPDELHHYRVFFEDYGCYEVLASRFIPPKAAVS